MLRLRPLFRPNGDELMATSELRRAGNLADGMVIAASVRARVLGIRLLTLDADIAVSPPAFGLTVHRSSEPRRRQISTSAPTRNGEIGGSLDDAARSLEVGAVELAAARNRMP